VGVRGHTLEKMLRQSFFCVFFFKSELQSRHWSHGGKGTIARVSGQGAITGTQRQALRRVRDAEGIFSCLWTTHKTWFLKFAVVCRIRERLVGFCLAVILCYEDGDGRGCGMVRATSCNGDVFNHHS